MHRNNMASSDDTLAVDGDEDEAHHHPYYSYCYHNLSRLSMCTTQQNDNCSEDHEDEGEPQGRGEDEDDDGDVIDNMGIHMAGLSLEGSEGDADGENSDKESVSGASSEMDVKESGSRGCLSLPATPPRQRRRRRRRRNEGLVGEIKLGEKDYASENEAERAGAVKKRWRRNWWRRGIFSRERSSAWKKSTNTRMYDGEGECMFITKPKGGRSLCMDLEEVKACRDLGFELDRISLSCSPADTSSGGNSPVANSNSSWRISSPGDDPRDVKAKLKVWAQAVALASATR